DIIERAFDDDEIRSLLVATRDQRVEATRRSAARRLVAERARTANRFDTREVVSGDELTIGLFREADVRDAVSRGHGSASCARRVTLRATGEREAFQVMDDLFNPGGGFFVTAEYDETVWRTE